MGRRPLGARKRRFKKPSLDRCKQPVFIHFRFEFDRGFCFRLTYHLNILHQTICLQHYGVIRNGFLRVSSRS
jgi:hypothetical protein